eukprot:TRINITY_DN25054_c0_g1_i1.p1 TRINITY_DN25054_c0_g1~~TRINITY_DN25054_c0_g1_i1.p1  ORF type:complete len:163 (+),score=14.42 TRINITY_DN25054_c0_g1_i1:87-575(+)
MRKWDTLAALCLALVAWHLRLSSAQLREVSAYEQLERNGFPRGLLPNTVVSYSLESDGTFSVHLAGKCSFTIPDENLSVSYSKVISGVLKPGKLSQLSGIQVKVLFFWVSITGIQAKNDNLVFEVGILSAQYPVSNFYEGPDCGVSRSALPKSGRSRGAFLM